MNRSAEQRTCIIAEERERLSAFERDEKIDKAIGASSLKEMLGNDKDTSGRKKKPNLPDEEELDRILQVTGIGGWSIREYKDILRGEEKEFDVIRTAIVTLASLLNILGLHADKIRKKNDTYAKYPVYHENSFRTVRSGYYDNDHLAFASKCTYFVTTDRTLCEKAKEIFDFLGIDTTSVMLDEFMSNKLV